MTDGSMVVVSKQDPSLSARPKTDNLETVLESDIEQVNARVDAMEKQESNVSPIIITDHDIIEKPKATPYTQTIRNLLMMQWIQCPIQKLSHIYNCLKFDLADDIEEFYSRVEMEVQGRARRARRGGGRGERGGGQGDAARAWVPVAGAGRAGGGGNNPNKRNPNPKAADKKTKKRKVNQSLT